MADNIELDAASGGAIVATDDIAGVHYPRSKIGFGADGTWVTASAGQGNADTGVLRVAVVNDDTNLAAIKTAVEGTVTVDNGGTFAVQVAGVSTAANQATIIGHVDGIETLLGTIDTDTGNVATSVATIAAAVSTEMQVDVVGALPAGTNAIGKLAANSGVDIGDVDVTSIAAGSNSIGGTKDDGPLWTTAFGVSGAVFTSADATTAAAVTDAPTTDEKLVITDIIASSDTAMFLLFQEETSGTVFLKVFLPANGAVQITPRSRLKLATANKKLMVDASAAGNIAVTAFYHSEA